jgi:hypothetical protein
MSRPRIFISYVRKSSRKRAEALHRVLGGDGGLAFRETSEIEAGDRFPKVLYVLFDAKLVIVSADEN